MPLLLHIAVLPVIREGFAAPLAGVEPAGRKGEGAGSRVRLTSLQTRGAFAPSTVHGAQLSDALLAAHLDGTRLTRDHGHPVRLIAASRPGPFQTRWLTGG